MTGADLSVLEVGSADPDKPYREVFDLLGWRYVGVDSEAGADVDMVLSDPYTLPFPDETFDVVFAGRVFEQSEEFWRLFTEMCRVATNRAIVIVIAPSSGPEYRNSIDCYRFKPDSMSAMARRSGVQVLEVIESEFGPWFDIAGIFSKDTSHHQGDVPPDTSIRLAQPVQNAYPPDVDPGVEHGAGTEDRYEFLRRAHDSLAPRGYVEIGVEYGKSLALARCSALGIDPAPQISESLDQNHVVCASTSDDFFWLTNFPREVGPIDLCYLDGMHQVEFALRDFMYLERMCNRSSVMVIDDVFPAHPLQGARVRQSRFWTGDVWKMIPILEKYRPDLLLVPVNTSPTGSLIVMGCDPSSRVLWQSYDLIIDRAIRDMTETPDSIVDRTGALDPQDPLITHVFEVISGSRLFDSLDDLVENLRAFIVGSLPRKVAV